MKIKKSIISVIFYLFVVSNYNIAWAENLAHIKGNEMNNERRVPYT